MGPRARTARIAAPDASRITVKLVGSIRCAPSAARHSSEFAANPTNAAMHSAAIAPLVRLTVHSVATFAVRVVKVALVDW